MRRRGFTIIELLIVIAIMLALTAMAIPLLMSSKEDRRITESTRIVTSMFAGARARAIEIGRPVGVMLEVDPTQAEMVRTLSYAEVPPLYAGGETGSRVIVEGEPFVDDVDSNGNYNHRYDLGESWTDWNANGIRDAGGFVTHILGGNGVSLDETWRGLIKPGDSLKVNFQGYEYTIGLPAMFLANKDTNGYLNALGPSDPWELATIRGGTSVAAGVMSDAVDPPLTVFRGPNPADPTQNIELSGRDIRFAAGTHTGGTPFQINRTPMKSAAPSLTLPETMCIDLLASSTAIELLPLLSSLPDATGNITIMYSPGGSLDSIRWAGGAVQVPANPVYLLVGKTYLVPSNAAAKPGEPVFSWQDLDSRWVLINQQSGLLTSSPMSSVDVAAAVDYQILLSRRLAHQGAYGDK